MGAGQEVLGQPALWGALASHLELKWYRPGVLQAALNLCHIGKMAGAVVSADQGCPGVHYTGATLVGCLGLVWAVGLGLTEVVGLLVCPDSAPVHSGRWRRKNVTQSLQPGENFNSSSAIWQNSRAGSFIF